MHNDLYYFFATSSIPHIPSQIPVFFCSCLFVCFNFVLLLCCYVVVVALFFSLFHCCIVVVALLSHCCRIFVLVYFLFKYIQPFLLSIFFLLSTCKNYKIKIMNTFLQMLSLRKPCALGKNGNSACRRMPMVCRAFVNLALQFWPFCPFISYSLWERSQLPQKK